MLSRGAEPHVELERFLSQTPDDGRHLDGLGPCSDDDENALKKTHDGLSTRGLA
jgi:hypothetical protein